MLLTQVVGDSVLRAGSYQEEPNRKRWPPCQPFSRVESSFDKQCVREMIDRFIDEVAVSFENVKSV